ncbi:MAG: Na+/H+ antiporter subunit E [Myxococcota bacterium]
MNRWFGRPWLSLVVAGTWLLANNSAAPGHLVLAALLGLLLPGLTYAFWPDAPSLRRPIPALRLMIVFAYDVLIANLRVARLVLGPNDRLRPAFLEVPIEIEDAFGVAVLASMITLTPGTLTVYFRESSSVLVVHALDVDDETAAIAEIKRRYESPLRKALGC